MDIQIGSISQIEPIWPIILALTEQNPLAIEIAATQAKSACADQDQTGAGRFCSCCREFIRRFQSRIGIAVVTMQIAPIESQKQKDATFLEKLFQ